MKTGTNYPASSLGLESVRLFVLHHETFLNAVRIGDRCRRSVTRFATTGE
jgi:hypothetical protein